MFKKYNLSIQVESNIKTTDFLDVILDLKNGTTRPYRKENDTPLFLIEEDSDSEEEEKRPDLDGLVSHGLK